MITEYKLFENKNNFTVGDIVIINQREIYLIIRYILDNFTKSEYFDCVHIGHYIESNYSRIVWSDDLLWEEKKHYTMLSHIENYIIIENVFYKNLPNKTINKLKTYNIDLEVEREKYFEKKKKKNVARKFNL